MPAVLQRSGQLHHVHLSRSTDGGFRRPRSEMSLRPGSRLPIPGHALIQVMQRAQGSNTAPARNWDISFSPPSPGRIGLLLSLSPPSSDGFDTTLPFPTASPMYPRACWRLGSRLYGSPSHSQVCTLSRSPSSALTMSRPVQGFLSSIAALPAFAQALDGYLIPALYTTTNFVLQGLFCLGEFSPSFKDCREMTDAGGKA